MVASVQALREARRAAGMCLRCGINPANGQTRCERCKIMHKEAAQRSLARKMARRVCADCQKPALPNQLRCEDHRRKTAERRLKTRQKLGQHFHSGKCIHCGDIAIPATVTARFGCCEVCYLKAKAAYHLGDRKRWQELKVLLMQQGSKCPYTGETLQLGINASIDHEKPASRFPELKAEISNIEWVTKEANAAKGSRTKEEFIEWISLLHKNLTT